MPQEVGTPDLTAARPLAGRLAISSSGAARFVYGRGECCRSTPDRDRMRSIGCAGNLVVRRRQRLATHAERPNGGRYGLLKPHSSCSRGSRGSARRACCAEHDACVGRRLRRLRHIGCAVEMRHCCVGRDRRHRRLPRVVARTHRGEARRLATCEVRAFALIL
jgi:hypothetical protein